MTNKQKMVVDIVGTISFTIIAVVALLTKCF
jgi:hypothetical protein